MSGNNANPGWYPTGDGRTGYWDGKEWTEFRQPEPAKLDAMKEAASRAAGRFSTSGAEFPPDTVWSAVGIPITGIGAGRYWMDSRHLYFERGVLSTDAQQVPLHQVMDVDVRQTMTQKARGVFRVIVHVNRGHMMEHVFMDDIREGREAQRVINEAAHHERLRLQQAQNTMRYQGTGYPLQPAAADESERPAPNADPIEQLERLGKLRDAGVVTDEEFAAKKAEILSRL